MTLAHLSDLHIGKSEDRRVTCRALNDALIDNGVDLAVVTGDVTEHGLHSEFREFKTIFSGLLDAGKMIFVPGNHDHWNEGVARSMMEDRIKVFRCPGFMLVALDSTGPHNRWRHAGHGKIDERIIERTLSAVGQADKNDFVAIALHHHLLPLPVDQWLEKISDFLRLPFAAELKLGQLLLEELRGKCDLVLHGHRHQPMEKIFDEGLRALNLYNAGSSTQLRGFRIFEIGDGRLVGQPNWFELV